MKKKYLRGETEWNEETESFENYDESLPVRKCPSNIAKMNVFEFIYFDFKYWCFGYYLWGYTVESFKQLILGLCGLITVLFFPITVFIRAKLNINRSKKEVKYYEKRNAKNS